MSDCHTSKTVVARKAHTCEEAPACRREIRPGDRYERHSGVYDGMPYSYALCARCARAHKRAWERPPCKRLLAHMVDYPWPPAGGLLEFLKEARSW